MSGIPVTSHKHYAISYHWQLYCLFSSLFRLTTKKTSKLRITAHLAKFMRPTWSPPGSCRPQMGPMLAPWTLLSGRPFVRKSTSHWWISLKSISDEESVSMPWPHHDSAMTENQSFITDKKHLTTEPRLHYTAHVCRLIIPTSHFPC